MTGVTPPVLTFSAGERTLEVDTGELLFPGLVLAFCLFYYWDTRALPDLSMLYAGPLLYATTALAVITLVQQAVSINGGREQDGSDLETASALPEPEPNPKSEPEASSDTEPKTTTTDQIFTVRNAALLVVLTGLYIVALELISFLVATVGYLAVTLYMFGEESLLSLTLYSIGFAFLLWIVFIQWLQVPL
ncbi:tripartite tricarboxylate transporter TctB family protein [Halopiger aswanensis]|uniref:Tripartite tricarboxylate transporter TctB family protein n=1 Tax=Halopiger aswanensis TaxID=148449 RepID=A0A3R7D6T2_9EURY|nr:tripartite tricarboxylate transporter TctB family protein [Halopiger aswanensis]RKD85921.1 tripartite tricarboxylate transporter TctB family protein [Halopiger aswanensis]